MSGFSRFFLIGCAVLLAFSLVGCGGGGDSRSAWTIQEGTLTLERNLLAGDDEPYFFGEIADVAARGDGRIYIADEEAPHVKVLAPDGTLQDTIGRKGKGPGEFSRPEQVRLARGDSLYVMDGYRSELSAFAPDHDFAYRVSLRLRLEEKLILFPGEVMPRDDSHGYFVYYGASPLPGVEAPEGHAIRAVNPGGIAGDTLFTVPKPVIHVERGDRRTTYRSIPFARAPTVAQGPAGHLQYAWSDSLGVRTYGPGGTLQRTVDIPFEPVPVTEADRERELSDRSEESEAAVEDRIPATKPAFEHFLVDNKGRYWFGRPTKNPDSTDWWVAWPEQQRVVTTTLPGEVQLTAVKNGQAYGRTTTENGVPALVRYRVRVAQ